MRWVIVFILLAIATPTWAAKKKNKTAKPVSEPQQSQQVEETQPSESDQWNQKLCPNGIEDWKALPTMNPFDSKGRCFNYQGGLVQMLDKCKGLFSFISSREPFAMVDFGKDSVPRNYWYGVVIGKGAYSYQTVRGDLNNIFSFTSVPKSKARAAWEKSQQIEKAKEEERKIADQRDRVEQEWMKKVEDSNNPELKASPLILKDPATGLMWARNCNIAAKKLEWGEAMEWAKDLNYAGYNDWRLPTKEEFEKFFKIKKGGKSKLAERSAHKWMNDNGFFNVLETLYWSSSKYNGYGDYWYFSTSDSKIGSSSSVGSHVMVVRDGKIEPNEYQKNMLWNQSLCSKGIENMQSLFTLNPYDSKGRCFNYSGRLVQLLNKHQAFFSILTDSTPYAFIDFGKDSVPMNFYSGVVIGKGAYAYETVSRSKKTILSFVPVPKSKEREEWEIEQKKEKKIKEENAANAQAKLKEEREKNPTYTDPFTGLMWTTCGNMGKPSKVRNSVRLQMTLDDAMELLKSLNYAGYNDWRLPTKDELLALAKRGGYFPSEWLNSNGFYDVEPDYYWTSTAINSKKLGNFAIDMIDGSVSDEGKYISYVWPVRDTK